MKADPVNFIIEKKIDLNKKLYFISGNEITFIEKIKDELLNIHLRNGSFSVEHVTDSSFNSRTNGLFEKNKVYVCKELKLLEKINIGHLLESDDKYIFVYENSPKVKKFKTIFLNSKDAYVFDCYELDRSSKIKILNHFISLANIYLDEETYWAIIEKLDNRFMLFENEIIKLISLEKKEVSIKNFNTLFSIDSTKKESLFFNIFKRNSELARAYKEKINSDSDVNELFYYFKFFCILIINNTKREEFIKAIPKYLFREKSFLIDVYNNINNKKKKTLILLLKKTETNLRTNSGLSVEIGLRFLFAFKKIIS